ncbi:hypothetical protein VCHC78A1_03332A, partial [Vibrio cholerae HC-78A1]
MVNNLSNSFAKQ